MKPRLAFSTICPISLVLCALLCGCVGAIRVPARALNPAGTNIDQKEIDLKFIARGTTQRDEVDHQLSLIDTAYDNPRIFWGRWSESRWGYWWVLGGACDHCMAGDAQRLWRIKNLVVAFDENGTVSSHVIVDDNHIWPVLHNRISQIQPPTLDLSQPVRITLTSADPVAIQMDLQGMVFERPAESRKTNVEILAGDITRFKHKSLTDSDPFSSSTCHTLELSHKSGFGKKINFCAEANQIGIFFEYLQQVGSPGMNWQ